MPKEERYWKIESGSMGVMSLGGENIKFSPKYRYKGTKKKPKIGFPDFFNVGLGKLDKAAQKKSQIG